MFGFLVGSLFPILALFFGIKALTPAGIELWEGRVLSRKASTLIGIATIILSLSTIAFLFAYCVLELPIV